MKITIKRAFERTRQIADFVPIKAYCEASTEVELEPREFQVQREAISSDLQSFCESEVEKTLINYRPACIICGGKSERSFVSKEGICGQCMKDISYKAAELKAENKKVAKT